MPEPSNVRISVVIASIVGAPFIDDCVASVCKQQGAPDYEVVVVDCAGPENLARLARRFPQVRFIERSERDTVPRLRRFGVEAARGEIVAVIEEHCVASEDWLATIANSLTADYVAVGGPIFDSNYERLRDWVTYFVEYNSYLPPWPEGNTTVLNGANLAYRRVALLANLDALDHGYWEATLHPKLLAEGARFRSVPGMVVRHRGPFNYAYYLRQRYLFSRAFAGVRGQKLSLGKRAAYVVASPAVAMLLLMRMASRIWDKRCHPDKFLLSLPLLVPAIGVYVFGESVGYALGPGQALMKVE